MNVIAFNASPRKDGNTRRLIDAALAEIEKEGIDTEVVNIGRKKVHGCIACMKCFENLDRRCIFDDDLINGCIEKMAAADGIIIASPTYFADMTPEAKALIDRAGFVGIANGNLFSRKVGAGISVARRAGAVTTVDSINHFFGISDMVTVGSTYWNVGFGLEKGDVDSDVEGIRTMQRLGQNMAWLVKKIAGQP
ncbi:flavodoxin family protein [Methanosphaerula palustris]|uniref:NADPH-dependent FMN reductase n=1 Tax=Methanosphaerula palustris (strain ATCC BAA-1556 / DSM 19958 / E1-9c) TaxID=521011 RepID=B8GIP3_METPE|nr:flavodoxin family protein [Methanosphaerula palustris]ACL16856.1 NADPH-dependent FMN reductase [Methanosphaerula palustris E1-9c]